MPRATARRGTTERAVVASKGQEDGVRENMVSSMIALGERRREYFYHGPKALEGKPRAGPWPCESYDAACGTDWGGCRRRKLALLARTNSAIPPISHTRSGGQVLVSTCQAQWLKLSLISALGVVVVRGSVLHWGIIS